MVLVAHHHSLPSEYAGPSAGGAEGVLVTFRDI
jgi:hypothetical protein